MPNKHCARCGEDKSIDEFYTSSNPSARYGRQGYCKPCTNQQRVEKNRWYLYGITRAEYLDRLKEQAGVCAICLGTNANGRELSVDHDHQTGAIRGLLCSNCNFLLGYARDSVDILAESIEYLRRAS